jgi:hypothetical protein
MQFPSFIKQSVWLVVFITSTNSMKQSLREASGHSTTEEISWLLCNLNIRYHVHKSLSLDRVTCQMKLDHTLALNFFEILNIILPLHPSCSSSLHIYSQKFVCICNFCHMCYISYQTFISFDYPSNVWWRVEVKNHLIKICSLLFSYILNFLPFTWKTKCESRTKQQVLPLGSYLKAVWR